MSHSHFDALVSRVMRGGLVPVAILGKTLIAAQLRDIPQTVVQGGVGDRQQSQVHISHDRTPPLAFESGKISGQAGSVLEAQSMLLEKASPTLRHLQYPLNSQVQKVLIGKIGTGPG